EETVYLSKGIEFNINDSFTIDGTDRLNHPVAIKHKEKSIFGLNFYPEKQETTNGLKIIETFALDICGCAGSWTIDSFSESEIAEIESIVGDKKVLGGVIGGVDSSVVAGVRHRAIGDKVKCIFVDHGLLRKNEEIDVMRLFGNAVKVNIIKVDAVDR